MSRFKNMILVSAVACCICPAAARATVVDFNSLAVGAVSGGVLNLTPDGVPVSFSADGLWVGDIGAPFNQRVLRSGNYQDPITVTFGSGYEALYVEIENHVNGELSSETDVIFGEAFDVLNVSLDTQTNSNEIHHLEGPGITKVVYQDVSSGYVIDNFSFQLIPEPSSWILAAIGLTVAAIGRHRTPLTIS